MQRRQRISIGIVSVLAILLVGLAAYYSDFLGARYIKIGSGRLKVYQGEINTLQLKPLKQVRKLEICGEKKAGKATTFVGCKTLVNSVKANATEVAVIIPATMALGPATVLTRIRDTDGTLQPLKPTDQKITLTIAASKKGSRGGGTSTASTSGTGGGSTSNTSSGSSSSTSGTGGGSTGNTGSSSGSSQSSSSSSSSSSSQPTPSPTPKVTPTPVIAPAPTPTPNYITCRLPEAKEISTQGTERPELALMNIDINPKIPKVGSAVTATITVKNIGPAASGKFSVDLLYDKYADGYSDPFTGNSRNTDPNVHYVKSFEVGNLDSDQVTTLTQTITNTSVAQYWNNNQLSVSVLGPYITGGEYDYSNNYGYCYWGHAN